MIKQSLGAKVQNQKLEGHLSLRQLYWIHPLLRMLKYYLNKALLRKLPTIFSVLHLPGTGISGFGEPGSRHGTCLIYP